MSIDNLGSPFEVDEELGEGVVTPEILSQIEELERQEQLEREQEAAPVAAPAPTQPSAPQPQPSAGGTQQPTQPTEPAGPDAPVEPSGEMVKIGDKMYPVEDVQYDTNIFGQKVANLTPEAARRENAARRQGEELGGATYLGQDLGDTNQQVRERLSAAGQGLFDFGIETANTFLPEGQQIAKPTPYEDGIAEATRKISSVVLPTIIIGGGLQSLGTKINTQVGHALGRSKFVQWIGARGADALTGLGVGAVSSEYEGDNLTGWIKKNLPPWMDFIPDSVATLENDGPDAKRFKNIQEDLSLGFLIPFTGALGKVFSSTDDVKRAFQIVPGSTPQSKAAIEAMSPESSAKIQARQIWSDTKSPDSPDFDALAPEMQDDLIRGYTETGEILTDPVGSEVAKAVVKQEQSLDELGQYNLMRNPENTEFALKGVHDLYNWNETGMRYVDDFGVVGASVDASRIANNLDTVNGRIGSMVSQPAVKYAGTTVGGTDEVVEGLARQLDAAGDFSVTGAGWELNQAQIVADGNVLVNQMIDPALTVNQVNEIINPIYVDTPAGRMQIDGGYADMFNATPEGVPSDLYARAQALVQSSMSGQVADMAEGIRLNRGSASIPNAQEQFRDNLMALYKMAGTNAYYTKSKARLAQGLKEGMDPGMLKTANDNNIIGYEQFKLTLQNKSDELGENLKWFEENEPQLLESFLELYEMTDGKIKDINTLNQDILDSFTKWRVIWDENPQARNILAGAIRANYINSTLSAGETAANALYGNLGGLIFEPISYFAGAVTRGDLKSIQRGWMAYSAMWDTSKKSFPYAGKMFMKASQNPQSVSGQTKLDFLVRNEEKLEIYKQIADVKAEQGNNGLKYLIEQYENLQDMANDPVFRFVPNLFTGFDGMARSTIANAEARFRAMDVLEQNGKNITAAEVKQIADMEYNRMFDSQRNLIVDEAVKFRSNEIALNVDNQFTKGLDNMLSRVPMMKTILMFPTTLANGMRIVDEILPYSVFQRDLNELAFTPVKTLMSSPERVDRLLAARGYKTGEMTQIDKLNTIVDIKNRVRGKKAIAGFIGMAAMGQILNDKLTGDGFYDKELQASRRENSNWKARTIEIPGGQRIEYEKVLGPGLSNWVATFANIHDNFDKLGEAKLENLRRKMFFILGGAMTDDTILGSLRPVVEMLQGNDAAWERWAAGQVNSLGPLGGARSEASRILNAGLKEVNQEFMSLIENKNSAFFLDQENRLPYVYNPVTGKIPNQYSMFQRLWNAYSPIKIHPAQTPEEKFLQEVDYDYSTSATTWEGVELDTTERSAILKKMGEQEIFKKGIKRIAATAAARNTVNELKAARDAGVTSEQLNLSNYDNVHTELRKLQKQAEKSAYSAINFELRNAIQARITEKKNQTQRERLGIIENLTGMRK